MKTSHNGIALIKRFEGCRLKAYQDTGGVWTIGYGHTSQAGAPVVKRGLAIGQSEADEILAKDLGRFETAVLECLNRTPTQPQFDAMVSLCFNIGPGAFNKSSVARLFNSGNMLGAATAFKLWNKDNGRVLEGLVKRRDAEAALFLSKSAPVEAPAAPQKPPDKPAVVRPAQDTGAAVVAAGGAAAAHGWGISPAWIIAGVAIFVAAFVAYRIWQHRKELSS